MAADSDRDRATLTRWMGPAAAGGSGVVHGDRSCRREREAQLRRADRLAERDEIARQHEREER